MASISLDLGPWIVHIGEDKVLGFCDEVTISWGGLTVEPTPEELTELQNAPMIYLVKLAPWQRRGLAELTWDESKKKLVKRENAKHSIDNI